MYTEFFGLTTLPFELSPDPKYLLMTASHKEALANLQYGISARKSLTLITGEAGTGKTTIVHAALSSPACRNARIVHLSNSMLTREEFVQFLATSFELSKEAAASKTVLLRELEDELKKRRAAGITTALVIDEAQCLERELLEEIRLLSNIETPTEKLLPLILVGQPEFAERLNLVSLRQLKQRVALRCQLSTLTAAETAAYIAGRIRISGGEASIMFTRDAVAEVHRLSGGVPRTISVICDNALVNAYALGVKPVTAEIVRQVGADFDLQRGDALTTMTSQEIEEAPAVHSPQTPRLVTPRAAMASEARDGGRDESPAPIAAAGKKKRFSFF